MPHDAPLTPHFSAPYLGSAPTPAAAPIQDARLESDGGDSDAGPALPTSAESPAPTASLPEPAEDIVDRLRRRAEKARERYPEHANDGATLVGGLIMDYEAAAEEIERLRAGLKDLARKALAAMRP